jgi:hypothetical protein
MEEGVFNGPMGANDGEEGLGIWVDQTGDVSDCLVRFFPGLFVDEGSANDGDGTSAWETELSRRQRCYLNGSGFYSSMTKLRTTRW